MEKIIYNLYEKYKVYIHERSLPDIIPIDATEYNINNNLAFLKSEFVYQNPIPIYYDRKLFKYEKQFYKSILYHEFTHIYDIHVGFKNIKDKDIFTLLTSTYSEYHASQIELLSQINSNSIADAIDNLNINSDMIYKDEHLNLNQYLIIPLADFTSVLDNDNSTYQNLAEFEFARQYVNVEKNIMYYLGKYDTCKSFASGTIFNLLEKNCPVFVNDIEEIHVILKSKEEIYNNVDKLKNAVLNFQNHYYSYFS